MAIPAVTEAVQKQNTFLNALVAKLTEIASKTGGGGLHAQYAMIDSYDRTYTKATLRLRANVWMEPYKVVQVSGSVVDLSRTAHGIQTGHHVAIMANGRTYLGRASNVTTNTLSVTCYATPLFAAGGEVLGARVPRWRLNSDTFDAPNAAIIDVVSGELEDVPGFRVDGYAIVFEQNIRTTANFAWRMPQAALDDTYYRTCIVSGRQNSDANAAFGMTCPKIKDGSKIVGINFGNLPGTTVFVAIDVHY